MSESLQFTDLRIPGFVKDDYPKFTLFVKAYYEWLSQNAGKLNVDKFRDIDDTIDVFVEAFKKEYLEDFPTHYAGDARLFLKHNIDFYKSKGSEESFRFLFRLLFDSEIDIQYPRDLIMTSSEGVWKELRSIKIQTSDPRITEVIGKRVFGKTSFSLAYVENIHQYVSLGTAVAELFISDIKGSFVIEDVEIELQDGHIITGTIKPAITTFNITNGGLKYENGQVATVVGGDLRCSIGEVARGGIDSLTITNGGINYTLSSVITVTDPTGKGVGAELQITSVSSGAITGVKIVKRGNGYENIPTVAITGGTGAILSLVSNTIGKIKSISIDNHGVYTGGLPTVTFPGYGDGNASVTAVTGAMCTYPGRYESFKSFASDIIKIQDGYKYQPYSYIIRCGQSVNQYQNILKKLVHPAGMLQLGEIFIEEFVHREHHNMESDGQYGGKLLRDINILWDQIVRSKSADLIVSKDYILFQEVSYTVPSQSNVVMGIDWLYKFQFTSRQINSFIDKPISDFTFTSDRAYAIVGRAAIGTITVGYDRLRRPIPIAVPFIELGNPGRAIPSIGGDPSLYGTAQAGTSTTLTLAASANTGVDYYKNMEVAITSGAGAGQVRTASGSKKNLVPNSALGINGVLNGVVGTIGSGGALPSGVTFAQFPAGCTADVVAQGVESNGLNYVDIRFYGTPTNVQHWLLNTIADTLPNGVVHTHSIHAKIVAGSTPYGFLIHGIGITINSTFAKKQVQVTGTGALVYYWALQVLTGGIGVPMDVTVRFGGAQMEAGATATEFIKTYNAAAVGITVPAWGVQPDATSVYEMHSSIALNTGKVGIAIVGSNSGRKKIIDKWGDVIADASKSYIQEDAEITLPYWLNGFNGFLTESIDGAVYVPSEISTLNQLSTGTTPVTVVTQPVGLVLDTRLGLALGPELISTLAGVVPRNANGTVSATADSVLCTCTANGYYGFKFNPTISAEVGKNYLIYCTKTTNSANKAMYVDLGAKVGGLGATIGTTQVFISNTTASNELIISIPDGLIGESFTVTFVSVKSLAGNHASQATSGARPTLQQDSQGFKYLSFLGTDDCLTSATGGGGSTGFFWCGIVQPTSGTGTYRELFSDKSGNNGYRIALSSANKLYIAVGDGTGFTNNKSSTASVDVGMKYLLTVFDDGVNLNVQINSDAIETVARPVVIAGSTGFTIGKSNDSALYHFIGNIYASVYVKNSGLTPTERVTVQTYVKALSGM